MAVLTYATVGEYRLDAGDDSTAEARVQSMLERQSAKLRALVGISADRQLTEDQLALARDLVVDAARKALVPPTLAGFAGDVTGASQASFSANGFSQSVQLSNPSGAAYFDRSTLAALRASLGSSQAIGTICPSYGRL